jgi:hypothetical protein
MKRLVKRCPAEYQRIAIAGFDRVIGMRVRLRQDRRVGGGADQRVEVDVGFSAAIVGDG